MSNNKKNRIRRAVNTRIKQIQQGKVRLVVHRTSRHIYAQIISSKRSKILISASTTERSVLNKLNGEYTGNKKSSAIVGEIIAKRSLKIGIKNVSFDRSGFRYHGRVKELANHARAFGLKF